MTTTTDRTLFTRCENQRMEIARQRRRIADLEAENARMRAFLTTPHATDAAYWRARCEVLEAEARLLRAANRGWAEAAR